MNTARIKPFGLDYFWLVLALAGLACCANHASRICALGVVLLYLGFSGWILTRHARQQRTTHLAPAADAIADTTLIAWASQTGFAEQLAQQSAAALSAAGVACYSASLGTLDLSTLSRYRQVLFIVSTTGEGDPPDAAAGFIGKAARQGKADLSHLGYGLLALGDHTYRHFCAFGHELAAWLDRHNAQPLFDLIEVDNGDAGALRHWQQQLSTLAGGAQMADWVPPQYATWTLQQRQLLNAGSAGDPVYLLGLTPAQGALPEWQAGDIVEVGPRHAPDAVTQWLHELNLDGGTPVVVEGATLPLAEALANRNKIAVPDARSAQALIDALPQLAHREYSIASLPSDRQLELLVRQTRYADPAAANGMRLGLGSGWLTEYAAPGASIALRIRPNSAFHTPTDERPLILIGNGTGLAGLRAHLKTRAARGHGRNWLIFGERNAAHDALLINELIAWQGNDVLERLDWVWSRDGSDIRYVQDQVAAAATEMVRWINAGAAIYVCGSLQGMASGVHHALTNIVGTDALAQMSEDGRYRRDVY
ncbi:sulfite reductase subunit alpha [Amantichitinum ursilacus]|uniref:NADPH--hemoprotein reductase n=1 Tax=Amantichitinum ursilacus TaxID=857265 RepID=A0A0N0GQ10_9NEIS|nr:sulfite reductase flavoprotein subunit alpha [Amantichitinum ursilacus]KPC54195.1 Sulfite reductase [NADPH] flavoprotein alpha-component [Amantichitinum ursilacus]